MITWYLIIVPSAVLGIMFGLLPFGIYLIFMQYELFIFPSQETYILIWKLFGCTIAAIIGIISNLISVRFLFSKKIAN